MIDGIAGFIKTRSVTRLGAKHRVTETFRVQVVGYMVNGLVFDSVEEANAMRDFHMDGETKIYDGPAPKEIVKELDKKPYETVTEDLAKEEAE